MSDPELRKIVGEVSKPGYKQRARRRAQRRQSPWNLLLIPLVFGASGLVCFASVRGVLLLSALLASEPSSFAMRSEPVKTWIVVPLLITAFPLGMIVANFLIHLLPPARRALDREAKGHPDTDFATAQRRLWAMGRIVFAIGFTISLLVAIFFQ